jgi:hypothetical protein
MPTGTIAGVGLQGVIYEPQGYSIWVKRRWADLWTFVPYLFPIVSEEQTGAAESSASFRWEYGNFLNLWGDPGQQLLPWNLNGWYIRIITHTQFGDYNTFIGQLVSHELESEGEDYSLLISTGVQTLKARGLEYLLMNRRIIGTWVYESGEGVARWISRTQPYNYRYSRKKGLEGNRSSGTEPTLGIYMHSKDGELWSNAQIAENILWLYQPDEPSFIVTGQWAAMMYVFEEHDFHGKTIKEALDELIDRKRGLAWRVVTDGVGPVYINVFSLSATTLYTESELLLEANANQVDLTFDQDPWVHPTIEVTNINQYDELVVESAEPFKVTATFSGPRAPALEGQEGNRKLESGWSLGDAVGYYDATDGERQSKQYDNVFSYLRVSDTMDFNAITPAMSGAGVIIRPYIQQGHFWRPDKRFLDWLPFDDESESDENQKREPFAIIQIPPSKTGDPEEYYVYIGKTTLFSKPETSLHLSDTDLAFWLRGPANHTFDNRIWKDMSPEVSSVQPEFDWATVQFTGQFETDQAIGLTLFPSGYIGPNGRQLHIMLKGIEVWYVASYTVIDVSAGEPVYHNIGVEDFVRDDTANLLRIALLAWVWYGQQRAVMEMTIKNNLNWFQIGTLIRTAVLGLQFQQVGTTVTSIRRDYRNGQQTITTGFGELDPAEFVPRGLLG